MKTLCIIPARGGSKRIPKKNIKDFFGKPLISYSIEVAKKSKLFNDIVVSTDDKKIADIAQQYGATVQFRPKELSDDFTGTGDVVKYVINALKKDGHKYDFACTIYATAPLLQEKYLIQGYKEIIKNNAKMVFSVTSMPFPIQRTFKITNDGRCKMFTPEHFSSRSQDLEEAYQDAGQFYWEDLDKEFTDLPFGQDSIPIVLPRYLVQDIDTLEDWKRAEFMYQAINQKESIEFLGYQVKIIYDDYNFYENILKNINDIERLCLSLDNKDEFYNVSYRKKYKVNGKILYSKKETIQIENRNIPLKYRLIENIHEKILTLYDEQDLNKNNIISTINDLNHLLKEIK